MTLKWFGFCTAMTVFLMVAPIFAQRGQGIGHVPGGITGPANGNANGPLRGTVDGTASQTSAASVGKGQANRGAGGPADSVLNVTQNAALSSHLQPLLPKGTTLSAAAAGFENEGQFVAALHVAHNLDIPFDQLKARMTGTNPISLGKAIQTLKPDLDGKTIKENVKLADRQTERDIQQAQSSGKADRVAARIASQTNLAARIAPLLPSGMTVATAAAGFKNEGQFLAALHVAKNLNIPFAEIKDRVTAGESLGTAIHELKPDMDAKAIESATVSAEEQAKGNRVEASASASTATGGNAGAK